MEKQPTCRDCGEEIDFGWTYCEDCQEERLEGLDLESQWENLTDSFRDEQQSDLFFNGKET
jgi:hypothetical protein